MCDILFRVFSVKTQVQKVTSYWNATKSRHCVRYLVSDANFLSKNETETDLGQIGSKWRNFVAEVSLSVAIWHEICFPVPPAARSQKVDLESLPGL